MTGLYIHIPFCASRCIYCGFYSTTALELRQQYVDALCREMELRGHDTLSTIYFGGGTPSQLSIPQLEQLFIYINKVYDMASDSSASGPGLEVTMEMNPDDVTEAYATALLQLGVNRVSMGAQTFDDGRLRFLHRRHNAAQVIHAVEILRKAGIANISIDLMYGYPDETLDDFSHDIDEAIKLDVEHISAYCLMIEEGTVLQKMKIAPCDEETERTMYELLIDRLSATGFEHYEISNWARPGYRSRHNSSYWHQVPYIGLGAAAHSYDGHYRRWNISDIRQYIDAINYGEPSFEQEELGAIDQYNEYIMLGLRTCEGINLDTFTEEERHNCLTEAATFISDGLLRQEGNRLKLSRRGLFVSDMIMSSLMRV